VRSGTVASDVGGAEAFGTLRTLELDSFAFVQRPVAGILNGGKVNEDILAARSLDESVALGSIEPLHNTMLFHWNSLVVLRPMFVPPAVAF
jgi:hypothetical protein